MANDDDVELFAALMATGVNVSTFDYGDENKVSTLIAKAKAEHASKFSALKAWTSITSNTNDEKDRVTIDGIVFIRPAAKNPENDYKFGMDSVFDLMHVKDALLSLTSRDNENSKGLFKQPSSVLLYGPPASAKTKIASAVAYEMGAHITIVRASDILGSFVGQSEEKLMNVFRAAEHCCEKYGERTIIFFDEIETLFKSRIDNPNAIATSLSGQFMNLMPNADLNKDATPYVVFAATNLPGVLDEALMRRFELQIPVPLPGRNARMDMIVQALVLGWTFNQVEKDVLVWKPRSKSKKSVRELDSGSQKWLSELAEKTVGFNGTDVLNMINAAVMRSRLNMFYTTFWRKLNIEKMDSEQKKMMGIRDDDMLYMASDDYCEEGECGMQLGKYSWLMSSEVQKMLNRNNDKIEGRFKFIGRPLTRDDIDLAVQTYVPSKKPMLHEFVVKWQQDLNRIKLNKSGKRGSNVHAADHEMSLNMEELQRQVNGVHAELRLNNKRKRGTKPDAISFADSANQPQTPKAVQPASSGDSWVGRVMSVTGQMADEDGGVESDDSDTGDVPPGITHHDPPNSSQAETPSASVVSTFAHITNEYGGISDE